MPEVTKDVLEHAFKTCAVCGLGLYKGDFMNEHKDSITGEWYRRCSKCYDENAEVPAGCEISPYAKIKVPIAVWSESQIAWVNAVKEQIDKAVADNDFYSAAHMMKALSEQILDFDLDVESYKARKDKVVA